MRKCSFYSLGMIVTGKCNMDCAMCLHGKKDPTDMSDEIIEKTLEQTKSIGTLSICGGEATLVIDRLEKIITYIIEHKIPLDEFTVTINGSIYSEELLRLLDEINNYIGEKTVNALFAISLDKYHLDEIKKLNIMNEFKENIERYKESKFFYGYRQLDKKLFREGNAENLDSKLTVPLRPMKHYITYANKKAKFDKENGQCNIGPLVSINQNGLITECDASDIHQNTIYNYGNVLTDSIEEKIIEHGAQILKPREYIRKCYRELKRYNTYNK